MYARQPTHRHLGRGHTGAGVTRADDHVAVQRTGSPAPELSHSDKQKAASKATGNKPGDKPDKNAGKKARKKLERQKRREQKKAAKAR